jgi:hypothetical protein
MATFLVFCWTLSLLFALLISLGLFSPLPATLAAVIGFIAMLRVPGGKEGPGRTVAADMARLREILRQESGGAAWKIVLTAFVFLVLLLGTRALLLPLLGWDSLTYHAVKAGLWVQTGGWFTLDAPGGWEYYRSFFGGGELFTAWAMLFLHSDLLAGVPDLVFWLFLGLVSASVAREFGLGAMSAMLVAMAFLCAPELSRLVGSGYVDTCATGFLLSGFLFLIRFGRSGRIVDLCLASAGFGLASSVKVNVLAVSLLMALAAIVLSRKVIAGSIRGWLLAGLCFAAPVLLWLLFNSVSTGYPLGSAPVSVGPVHLGEAPPNLQWFLTRPDLVPYVFISELRVLHRALRPVGFALVLSVVGFAGMYVGLRERGRDMVLAFLLIAATVAFYLSPSFSVVRLGFSFANGRFLAPAFLLSALAGLPVLERFRHGAVLLKVGASIVVFHGIDLYLREFVLDRHFPEILFMAAAAAGTVPAVLMVCKSRVLPAGRNLVLVALLAILLAAVLLVSGRAKDSFRNRAYAASTVMHDIERYWVDGLVALDGEPAPARIAFAYGPAQTSHRAFLAPFLGGHLNNALLYVSPESDGAVLPHHPDFFARSRPSFDGWLSGLHKAGATHVLCLRPGGLELEWVQAHPEVFTILAGEKNGWGLFRVGPQGR